MFPVEIHASNRNLLQEQMPVLLSLTSLALALCLVDGHQELIVASFYTGCGGSGEEKEELFFCVASVAFCEDPGTHRIFLWSQRIHTYNWLVPPPVYWMSWDRPSVAVKWCQLKLVAFYSFNWVTCKPGLNAFPAKAFQKISGQQLCGAFKLLSLLQLQVLHRESNKDDQEDPDLWKHCIAVIEVYLFYWTSYTHLTGEIALVFVCNV